MTASEPRALERCVGDPEAFLASAWAKRPVHHRAGGSFEDLMSLNDVDHMVTAMSLRLPAFRLVRDGQTIPTSSYTKTGRTGSAPITGLADPARILELFAGGATIVLQGMHRYWLPLTRFCRELELALGHPAQVNAYITPPGSRGLAVHSDSHDVFVLQSFGSKHWEVWEPSRNGEGGEGPPLIAAQLQPGDTLYMPKGTPHGARTQMGVSGHLTVGILTSTWGSLLTDATGQITGMPQFDEPLPAGYHRDPEGFATAVEARIRELQRWLDKAEPRRIADDAVRRFLTSRRPILTGGLADMLAGPELRDSSTVRRRWGSVCELRLDGPALVALLGDRELRMPAWLEPAMRWIATRDSFRIDELASMLDDESRLVLARRLVREGLLEVPRAT